MSNDEIKEEKFDNKGWDGKRKSVVNMSFKIKVEVLEEAVFESGAVNHAAQLVKTLEDIDKFIQKICNSDS